MTPKLILFDLDGTLAEFKTGKILPNVKNTLDGIPAGTQLAIVSNQGGVGLRYWMEIDDFGSPSNFPTETAIRAHVKKVCDELGIIVPVYLAFAYQSQKSGKWNPEPDESETESLACWSRDWRKPQGGMLIQAMKDAEVSPDETLMVGDSAEDELAAALVGCQFQWDYEFFNREKVQSQ